MNTNTLITMNVKDICLADYQRPVSKVKIFNIVKDYDPDRDRPIEVSLRNGEFFCFDGQHRLIAHKVLGMSTIQAHVHKDLTYEQEAALFAKQNDNAKAVSAADRWNASVEAGNEIPHTKEILAICKDMGFKVSAGKEKYIGVNTISCVQELQSIYKDCGERGLRLILKIVKDAWNYQPKNTNRMILGGLHFIYTHFGDELTAERLDRMAEALGEYTPKSFLREVAGEDRMRYKGVAQQIVKIHNRGLNGRSRKRLDKEMLCEDY